MNLTQEQLNAGVLIDALSRLNAINTNPKFGFGRETLDLVKEHIKHWDYSDKKALVENFLRIIENFPRELKSIGE